MNSVKVPAQGFVYPDAMNPVSTESEGALLGSILRGGREVYAKACEIVTGEMFWSTSHRSVWECFERLYNNGMQIDVIVTGDEMELMQKMGELEGEWGNGVWSGRAYLADLRSNGDPRNVETYAVQVQDYYFKRFLLQFSGKIGGWSANGRRPKEIVQDIYAELSKLQIHDAHDEHTVPIATAIGEAYDWTDKAARGEVVGVPTGLVDLDKLLGSLVNGNMYLLAARPKRGKTGLLLTIARNVARSGKRVGIFSLEMSRLQVGQRLIAQESGINLQSIINGKLRDDEWAKYTHAVEVAASYPIVINDMKSINVGGMRNVARRIKAEGGLDLLIVDYIQLAGSENKRYENRNVEVTAISRGLVHLAGELDVPILAAAQLNRAIEARASKRPILSDLRESGSLEQDAYAVMFLHELEDETKQNIIGLELAAHRNGPTGVIELLFRDSIVKFENLFTKYSGGDLPRAE